MTEKDVGKKTKSCFVIGPIGETVSPERFRADRVFKYVIEPAVSECGYETIVRADMDDRPGMIGKQIISRLISDDLVVADLAGHNPNVFYELAIRHMVRLPIVQIIQKGERIPFDVGQVRTIPLDHTDLESADQCRKLLVRQIRAVEADHTLVDNPISEAVSLRALEQSPLPESRVDAQILVRLSRIEERIETGVEHNGLRKITTAEREKEREYEEQFHGIVAARALELGLHLTAAQIAFKAASLRYTLAAY